MERWGERERSESGVLILTDGDAIAIAIIVLVLFFDDDANSPHHVATTASTRTSRCTRAR